MEYQIKPNQKIPSDILDDLASRFIINIPVEERSDFIRLCFQIELAYWFYIDFICKSKTNLTGCGNKVFALQLFQHIPFLRVHVPAIDKIFDDWKQYKLSVPTYGAILLSEDLKHVLLVQSFWAKSSWGFPKGKINENEPPINCAIREVFEETGFNIGDMIDPNEYIELVVSDQYTRLYIIPNVSKLIQFQPQTRNEIKSCEWFPLEYLPVTRYDNISKANLGINSNSFFMITPFVKRLKKWVNNYRQKSGTGSGTSARQRHHSTGDLDSLKRSGSINKKSNDRRSMIVNSASTFSANKNSTNKPGLFQTTPISNDFNAVVGGGRNSAGALANSTPSTSLIFTNSKLKNQPFETSTPQNQQTHQQQRKLEIKRKLFESSPTEKEGKSNAAGTIRILQRGEKNQNKSQQKLATQKMGGKNNVKVFALDNLFVEWKDFKFDLEKLLPKF